MKTKKLRLLPRMVHTDSIWIWRHKNGQMGYYEEIKNGIRHGDSKVWWRDGRLYCHHTYENGKLVKSE